MSLAALYARGGARLSMQRVAQLPIAVRRWPLPLPLPLPSSLSPRSLHASSGALRGAGSPDSQPKKVSAIDAGFLPYGNPEDAPPLPPNREQPKWLVWVLAALGVLSFGSIAVVAFEHNTPQQNRPMDPAKQERLNQLIKERQLVQQRIAAAAQAKQAAQTTATDAQRSTTSQSLTSLPRAHSAAADTEQPLVTEPPFEVQQANTARLAQLHSDARSIFQAALDAADPRRMILSSLSLQPRATTDSDANATPARPACDLVVQLAPGRTLHYDLGHFRNVVVVGAGKAATAMAAGVEQVLAPAGALTEGLVVTKYGHAAAGPALRTVRVLEAAHPVPDEAAVEATRQVGQLLDKYAHDPSTLLLVLLSGGGSALWTAPEPPLTLCDIQGVNRALLHAAMPIGEMNLLRKHLDVLKGGGLLRRAGDATILALVLSDVIGDDLGVIASAPTVPAQRDFLQALALLDKYDLRPSRLERDRRRPADEHSNAFPLRAYEFLLQGAKNQVRQVQSAAVAPAGPPLLEFDSTHPGAPAAAPTAAVSPTAPSNVTNVLVGSNRHSLDAAARRARELGYDAHVLTDRLDGEAAVAAEWLARAAIPVDATPRSASPAPRAWIAGGETTVTFAPSSPPAQSASQAGLGGRSQEFALAAASHLYHHEVVEGGRGECRTVLLAGGSDGTDGPTDATGAVVDARTWSRAQQAGLDGTQYLRRHDSYNFFNKLDSSTQQQQQQQHPLSHLKPGPTGTNVGDIYLALSR